jgi:branched-chain amino acid aminotransferase
VGPVMKKLRETLTSIQDGEIEGPEGWVVKIM